MVPNILTGDAVKMAGARAPDFRAFSKEESYQMLMLNIGDAAEHTMKSDLAHMTLGGIEPSSKVPRP
jgi:hypothetical protein